MADDTAPTTTKPKNKGGRPAKKPVVPADTVIEIASTNDGYRKLADKTGIGNDSAKVIKKVTGLTVEEFMERQKAHLEELMQQSLAQTKKTLGDATAMQSATVYGILHDKYHKQSGGQAAQHLHLHLGGKDREGLLGSLLGRHGERVSAHRESVSISKPAAPVIDLPPGDPAPNPCAVD